MSIVKQGFRDITIIPDKYNTGCDESLITTTVSEEGTYNGVFFGNVTGQVYRSLSFQHTSNEYLGSEVLIENTYFPDGIAELNASDMVRTVTFRNCKISGIGLKGHIAANNVNLVFEDCTIAKFSGSDQLIKRCLIGNSGSSGDGLNPYKNVTCENSFIYKLTFPELSGITHCDAVQIYGYNGIDAENIHFLNCRMEVPMYPMENSVSTVYANACIMIQLEYSNGIDISFEDCVINGGGYTIYCWAKSEGTSLQNVLLDNIDIGYAHRWGNIYGTVSEGSTFSDVGNSDKLYISNVWKDELNHTHISVSNDTLNEKKLIVYTNSGYSEYTIPACFNSFKIMDLITQYYTYEDYPFDIDLDIGEVDFFVAFDEIVSVDNQIRFVNYTEVDVEFPQVYCSNVCNSQFFINRRRRMLMTLLSSISYTELNYLRSTGTQYIDTGEVPIGDTTKIEIEIAIRKAGISNYIVGSRNASLASRFYIDSTASSETEGTVRSEYNTGYDARTDSNFALYNKFKIVKDKNVTYFYDSLDNLITSMTRTISSFIGTDNIYLFAINSGGSVFYGENDIFSYKKYENDILVQDFIPVLDESNVPCMYDKVSKTFFYNQGTGYFLYG